MIQTIQERERYWDGIRSEVRYGTQGTSWNDVIRILLVHRGKCYAINEDPVVSGDLQMSL